MIDHPAYRAVVAEPYNYRLRLACADWFEECGDAIRAEYIRLELEVNRLERNHNLSQSKTYALQAKTLKTFKANKARWNAPIHQSLGEHGLKCVRRDGVIRGWGYKCGFPETITLSINFDFERHWPIVRQIGPITSLVFKTGSYPFAFPAMRSAYITEREKSSKTSDASAKTLCANEVPEFVHFVRFVNLQSQACLTILKSNWLARLRRIEFRNCEVDQKLADWVDREPWAQGCPLIGFHSCHFLGNQVWPTLLRSSAKIVRIPSVSYVEPIESVTQQTSWLQRIRQRLTGK